MLHYLILLLHDVIGFSNNYLIIGECLKENWNKIPEMDSSYLEVVE
jgi:hypothetical protein